MTGSDIKVLEDPPGFKYKIMSKLALQFLNARKVAKEDGYIVDDKKSGRFLQSGDETINPVISKGEIEGEEDEFIMIFEPVYNRDTLTLLVEDEIKVQLSR